jgi:hypothetical protein
MIKLMPLSSVEREKHFELLSDRFERTLIEATWDPALSVCSRGEELLAYFWCKLESILIGPPSSLISVAEHVKSKFFRFHLLATNRPKNGKTTSGSLTFSSAEINTLKLVEACFDYDKFCRKTTEWGLILSWPHID